MAEFKTVMRDFQRMCSGQKCGSCPVGNMVFNERESYCCAWVKNHPEEAERIIMDWSKANPIMTNRDKFKEVFVFSFVDLFSNGIPRNIQDWLNSEYKGGQDNGSD